MKTVAERNRENGRDRKKVELYSNSAFNKSILDMAGDGKKLSEIPEIAKTMKGLKKASDTTIMIHKILYATKGGLEDRKKEIMNFSGLKESTVLKTEELIKKKQQYLEERLKLSELVEVCRIFCLAGASKVKTAKKYAEEIVEFMKKPGKTNPVVTAKDKVADVIDEESSEEEPVKKPRKPAADKKKTNKKGSKTEDKKTKKTDKKSDKKTKTEKAKEDKKKVDSKKSKATDSKKKGPKKPESSSEDKKQHKKDAKDTKSKKGSKAKH
ncbi:Protein DEK [Entamoeba marina]